MLNILHLYFLDQCNSTIKEERDKGIQGIEKIVTGIIEHFKVKTRGSRINGF